jgi:hypothetical protein
MLRSHIILNDFELLMTFGSIGIHEPHMKLNGPKKSFVHVSQKVESRVHARLHASTTGYRESEAIK